MNFAHCAFSFNVVQKRQIVWSSRMLWRVQEKFFPNNSNVSEGIIVLLFYEFEDAAQNPYTITILDKNLYANRDWKSSNITLSSCQIWANYGLFIKRLSCMFTALYYKSLWNTVFSRHCWIKCCLFQCVIHSIRKYVQCSCSFLRQFKVTIELLNRHLKNVYVHVRFHSNEIEALKTMCLRKKWKRKEKKTAATRSTMKWHTQGNGIKKERVT